MGDSKTKAKKPSKIKGLKAEFKKIIWPDKKTLGKQTVAVVSVTVILGSDYLGSRRASNIRKSIS